MLLTDPNVHTLAVFSSSFRMDSPVDRSLEHILWHVDYHFKVSEKGRKYPRKKTEITNPPKGGVKDQYISVFFL